MLRFSSPDVSAGWPQLQRRWLPAMLLGAASISASACQPDPSYELRWRIVSSDSMVVPTLLTSAAQCSSVGIASVRVETSTKGDPDDIVATREYPCFPRSFVDPKAHAAGVYLEPGSYEVKLTGLSRQGKPYAGVNTTTQHFDVREEELTTLDDVDLRAPMQCIDGVDNDHDGAVDHADPACQLDPGLPENFNVDADTRFRLRTSFFQQNPEATCARMNVSRISVLVDGQPIACAVCRDEEILFAHPLAEGDHILEMVAARPAPGADESETFDCSVPLTKPGVATKPFSGGFVEFTPDFDAADFLTPFVTPINGQLQLRMFTGDDRHFRTCDPASNYGGNLVIDSLRVRVRDETGAVVDPSTLDADELDGTPSADGALEFMCASTMRLQSEPYTWGHYHLEIEARAGDNVCFGHGFDTGRAPLALVPNDGFLIAERIIDENGSPPPGCYECMPDDAVQDCACDDTVCCRNHICYGG